MSSIEFAQPSVWQEPDVCSIDLLRRNCEGVAPLDGRLEPWMAESCRIELLQPLIDRFGSPLNMLSTEPFIRNVMELRHIADSHSLDFEVYFARKANKCLRFVDAVVATGCGIDTASDVELDQVLSRGVDPARVISTAAIKGNSLMRRCLESGVVMAIDNADELHQAKAMAAASGQSAPIALRISGFEHEGHKLSSRFGFDVDEIRDVVDQSWNRAAACPLTITGIHFHLDGYCPEQRCSAIRQSLVVIDDLRKAGHSISFLDMGGGFPISYLESKTQWQEFWSAHREALLGRREPITYGNHGLGLLAVNGELYGERRAYPYYQTPVRGEWFDHILRSSAHGTHLADAIRSRNLQLRCEPGRSVLDGCGMTVARVEFRKQHVDGHWLIGLSMNRTQCRTSSDDMLVDPLLVAAAGVRDGAAIEGYLVGAYCTESELLTLRRMRFPRGVQRGDLVVFPNTAGYFMHFLESRSHQFPLAKNVFLGPSDSDGLVPDPIDRQM